MTNSFLCLCLCKWDFYIPFSVRSLLKESVLERPGSEMTFDPSLTVKSMERYPWGSLRSYSSVSSWAKVISGGNGWPGEKRFKPEFIKKLTSWSQLINQNLVRIRCVSFFSTKQQAREWSSTTFFFFFLFGDVSGSDIKRLTKCWRLFTEDKMRQQEMRGIEWNFEIDIHQTLCMSE